MSETWACAEAPRDRRGRGACPEAPVFSCYTGDHLQSGSTSSWIINPVWSERWWRRWVCGGCELCFGLWFQVSSSLYETDALNVFTSYKKTSETLSTAGQKTSAAFSTLSSTISRKFEDMRYAASCSSAPVRTPSPHSGLYWCLYLSTGSFWGIVESWKAAWRAYSPSPYMRSLVLLSAERGRVGSEWHK